MMVRLLVLALALGAAGALASGCDPMVDSEYVGEPGGPGDVERCNQEPPPDEKGCRSEVSEFGLLCSDCAGDRPDDSPRSVECLPAQCAIKDRCLECVDPKGRVGVDCCEDYFGSAILKQPFYREETWNSCHTATLLNPDDIASTGQMSGSTSTCHYPGESTCTFYEIGSARSYSCSYPDGSARGDVVLHGEPVPDPTVDRSPVLPEAGSCMTVESSDGYMTCTTCTRGDRSAITSCHLENSAECIVSEDDSSCAECTGWGWTRTLCDPLVEP
jgi:hypothetical protein